MTDGDGYVQLRASVAGRLAQLREPVFTTDADVLAPARPGEPKAVLGALVERFLVELPESARQEYRCAACQRFIARYGALVTIDARGQTTPLLWRPAQAESLFVPVVKALHDRVAKAAVTGVFLDHRSEWGTAQTGDWRHLAGTVDASVVHRHALLSAGQRMAELREDFGTLGRALADYDSKDIATVLRLLQSDQLYRSEKVLGVGRWLSELDASLRQHAGKGYRAAKSAKKRRVRDQLLWRAVATAPTGFCHVRSSMIGTLLDDVAAGASFQAVERAFRAKMDPLRYQRPQAEPSAGNIRQAEAIFAKLDSAGALARRFARLEDLRPLWSHTPSLRGSDTAASGLVGAADAGRVFEHLRGRDRKAGKRASQELPAQTMTWVKFRKRVLPDAGRVELLVGETGHFYAFATAVDADAPPILQWDSEQQRNRVTWYTHSSPPAARDWSILPGWNDLRAISLFPHQWFEDEDRFSHHGFGVLLVIDGCRPKQHGTGLFPEFMRSEYRAIRKTLEAHMNSVELAEREQASACGIAMRSNVRPPQPLRLRVHPKAEGEGLAAEYALDRWD